MATEALPVALVQDRPEFIHLLAHLALRFRVRLASLGPSGADVKIPRCKYISQHVRVAHNVGAAPHRSDCC